MNKGDTLDIILDYQVNGEDITERQFDEIELQLEKEKDCWQVKLLLSKGDIVWDAELNKYVARLNQEDTFKFINLKSIKYQLRLLDGHNVFSSEISSFAIGDVLSRKVLDGNG